jgi:hypothetical protein
MPALTETRAALIEQPFSVGERALLDGLQSLIPNAADQSVQGLSYIPGLVGRFSVANIKLDKCGDLTEALAMAPAFPGGHLCNVVDLDGPIFLRTDRAIEVQYAFIMYPATLWGNAREGV